MKNLILVRPSEDYRESCLAAIQEFQTESAASLAWYYNITASFAEFVSDLRQRVSRKTETIVPESVFWGVIDGEFVGRVSIRHELTDFLARVGGHIGYEVRPSFRRLGIGTELLRLALPEAKRVGLDRVLVTCDETNLGSIKIIVANGGIYSGAVELGEGKPKKQHYWIDLV